MKMRFEYILFTGIIIVILLLTGFLTFSGGREVPNPGEEILVFGVGLNSLLALAMNVLAGILFFISILAYQKDKRTRFLFVSGAFFLFTVEGFLFATAEFTGNPWFASSALALNFGILLLFFAGLVKK
jgi:hypothetical protein